MFISLLLLGFTRFGKLGKGKLPGFPAEINWVTEFPGFKKTGPGKRQKVLSLLRARKNIVDQNPNQTNFV